MLAVPLWLQQTLIREPEQKHFPSSPPSLSAASNDPTLVLNSVVQDCLTWSILQNISNTFLDNNDLEDMYHKVFVHLS